ncbi:helix-turn-helix domain-containing protein [Bacillus sp. DTU_2020_1000418_1_SI_GHA_SEK_038]|uniref:PucR family transcriptional regulator n=1 Tax=Bacillus sp. DTU_2020_1000418_1_SI_GHA_SEK_038 TaxID=3077585 RepID=UPI0028E1D9B9|nr:helix-turn-helix domain-containing protein [Bacillus sp. DTU_2020_1000418_1_SI_GHA_SEK_038]WNS75963.1 helix-turn-helix domain-containing protein [Bacillus sp. DTU_2020_1000418_1_SI_GHA_SEK_038]
MKILLQDVLFRIPLYQLTFLTSLPKENTYFETVSTTIPDQWFESSTLLLLDSDEECLKLSNKNFVNQLIQDSNLIGIILCHRHEINIQEDCLLLLRECKVPLVRAEEALSISDFLEVKKQHHAFSMLSMELNGFMNKGFMKIAENLSAALETPFLFFDENNQLLWQIGSEEDIEKVLQWLQNDRRDKRKANNSNISLPEDNPVMGVDEPYEQYIMNIAGQVQLTLVTLANLKEWQRIILDKFIGLSALFFQTEEIIREQREQMKEHFIYDLLYRKFESKKVLIKQAKTWGWDLEKPHHLFVIDAALSDEWMMNLEWMDEMIVFLQNHLSYLNDQVILFSFQDQMVVLLKDDENRNPSNRKSFVFEIAATIEKELSSHWSGCQFHIGIGKWCQDSVNLNKSYQEAKMALSFGKVWLENNHVFHINDLGIFNLIIHLHKEILHDFCEEYLSSLIESDNKLGTEYLKTLKAYFQYQGNINEVSEALYIHPNTLRNRLKKIEEMTGVYLQNNVDFLNLMVAVKIHYSISF